MLWKWLKQKYMTPIHWFWNHYLSCEEEGAIRDMALWFLASLACVAVETALVLGSIALLFIFCVSHPVFGLIIGFVVWLYWKGKPKKSPEAENTEKQEMVAKEQAELQMQAEHGYASMLNVMYQTIRAGAVDVGGVTPTFMAEIEMPEHYRLKDGICFYTFMLEKQDIHSMCSEKMLEELKNTLQFKLHNKLQSGAFPSISLVDYHDAHGGMDGIVIHALEDNGTHYVIFSTYASPEYSEYRYQKELLKTKRSEGNKELTTSWDELK